MTSERCRGSKIDARGILRSWQTQILNVDTWSFPIQTIHQESTVYIISDIIRHQHGENDGEELTRFGRDEAREIVLE